MKGPKYHRGDTLKSHFPIGNAETPTFYYPMQKEASSATIFKS